MFHFNAPFSAAARPVGRTDDRARVVDLAPVVDEGGALRRPRLLVRAARAGAALYRRERHLAGLLPGMASSARRGADVAARLRALEADFESRRRAQSPDYSPARHVAALSALLAETAALEARAAA